MRADDTRLFFKRHKYWKESILPFAKLVSQILIKGEMDIIELLLQQNEGLIRSIVQWGFWDEEHRPDIVKEIGIEECSQITNSGVITVSSLMKVSTIEGTNIFQTDNQLAMKIIDIIGCTPIRNKDYDTGCMVSFVGGMIRSVKSIGVKTKSLFTILQFIENADCVDKGIITEIIDFGVNHTKANDYGTAEYLVKISFSMLWTKQEANTKTDHPSDTRTAFAIRAGLIEMCLHFIERFGWHEFVASGPGGDDGSKLLHYVGQIFGAVHNVSLHQKTQKAIRSKKCSIEQELTRLEQDKDITVNSNVKDLFGMVRSILNLNGSYCCRCNKSLDRANVKECNGCNKMAYCSKACQKEDWLSGHSQSCCKSYYVLDWLNKKLVCNESLDNEKFQGRIFPAAIPDDERYAAKLEELEKNLTMVQLKLFLDNSELILSQIKELGTPFCDCVVRFDLRYCPPMIFVTNDNEDCTVPETKKGGETSRSEENITCGYICAFNGESAPKSDLYMQRLFSHAWLYLGTDTINTSNDATSKRRAA